MEKETSPRQKLAEIIKRLEANGRKVTDTSDKIKSIGFIGGNGPLTTSPLHSDFRGRQSFKPVVLLLQLLACLLFESLEDSVLVANPAESKVSTERFTYGWSSCLSR